MLNPEITLRSTDVPRVLASKKLVAVHCWAAWNGHDRLFANDLWNVLPDYSDRVDFYSFDVEAEGSAPYTLDWDVRNVPAFVGFFKGQRLETSYGMYRKPPMENQIRETLDRWLKRSEATA